jgi:hypothetical protein
MNDTAQDLTQENGPALPGRRQILRVGVALAAASLLSHHIARAQAQPGQSV